MKRIRNIAIFFAVFFAVAFFFPKNAYSQYVPSAGYIYNSSRISAGAAARRRAAYMNAGSRGYSRRRYTKKRVIRKKIARRIVRRRGY